MIAVGLIGEYLARLGANVRRRPLGIVSEDNRAEDAIPTQLLVSQRLAHEQLLALGPQPSS